jgi:hypothetical protein
MDDFTDTQTEDEAEKEHENYLAEMPGLIGYIWSRFELAEDNRRWDEGRWVQAYRDYRGIYSPDTLTGFKPNERSRIFVKIPKSKTLAAYGQLVEIVFAGNKFPLAIEATPNPQGIAKKAHLDSGDEAPEEPDPSEAMNAGFPGDGKREGEVPISESDPILGGLSKEYKGAGFVPGKGIGEGKITIDPAKEAAKNMERSIHDQLTETQASKELRGSLFEATLYGTGIVKGPFSYEKSIPDWTINTDNIVGDEKGEKSEVREYTPRKSLVPKLENVSVWNFYPDPSATSMDNAEYVIERHKLNRIQMRDLMQRPFFNQAAIRDCLENGPNYVNRGFESLTRADAVQQLEENRWEVLEYWGVMDADMAVQVGLDLGDVSHLDEVQVNVWICGQSILRLVLNPFEPESIPYHVFPYENDPTMFWGVGIPENMADSTLIMNGHARMAIDNLALSGNMVFDIDENSLVSGQSMDLFPGKIFRRQAGSTGQAVFGIKFPNTTVENMSMFDRFRQLADEQTGIPSFSHGQTGVQSTTRTASGMSMLMGAASLSVKTVIKNLDDYLLQPMGESFFYWNMQFNQNIDVRGDLSVKATGTSSVIQKEVRSQRLTQLLGAVLNPVMAPFFKLNKIAEELAVSLDFDPDDLVNDPEEAKLFAQILGEIAQPMNEAEAQGGAQGGPGGAVAGGPTGNGDGTIGTGGAPGPGAEGFSANTGQGE